MSKTATLKDVRDFFSTPDRPVSLAEMKALTKEDKTELSALVAVTL